jgi:VanZ family protein
MTVVPAPLRLVTGLPHNIEHAVIFFAAGIAVGLGYELRLSVVCSASVVFCAGLELVQLAIPGRHARVSDFIVDAAAACTGIGIAWTMRRLANANRLREGNSTAELT